MSTNRLRNLTVAAILLGGGIAVGLTLSSNLNLHSVSLASEEQGPTRSGSLESPFVTVANKVLPAVVSIEVKRRVQLNADQSPYGDLFRRFFPDVPQDSPRRTIPLEGSGFIIDREGHILTNNHVVTGASDITVHLLDHRTFKARVLGRDPSTDVALVKIDGDNLPVAELGNSDDMRVGDWAIAIGNPLGELEGSLTVGVVSAKGRAGLHIGERDDGPIYQDFIQTDAAINFGNSGGPLCNIHGQAIGINTAINAAGQGIGFAIPINIARKLLPRLEAGKPITHGFLGIAPQELDENLAAAMGLPGGTGVVAAEVTENSPAARAGIQHGDVVTEFNRQRVTSVGQFRRLVADAGVGERVPVVLVREGQQHELTVTLAQRSDDLVVATPESSGSKDWLGLRVENLDRASLGSARRRSAQDAEPTAGVSVSGVDDGSPADEAGIEQGDVIQEVNGVAVNSTADFQNAVRKARGGTKPIYMRVLRGQGAMYVALKTNNK
ncbi:MAG TPA: Do family serine endopeptidase [Candidatus Saccharimonadales bacterium]|nr:Do family serine endopeptidase [Candidatus Saccharimonadales bacterium]